MATQDDYIRMTIRLPSKLREKLNGAARNNAYSTSINTEIVNRLSKSFNLETDFSNDPCLSIIQAAEKIKLAAKNIKKYDNIDNNFSKEKALKTLSEHEKKILTLFNSIPGHNKNIILSSLLDLIKTINKK